MKFKPIISLAVAGCIIAAAQVSAQQGQPKGPGGHPGVQKNPMMVTHPVVPVATPVDPSHYGLVHLVTELGSFKIQKIALNPAEGTLDMSFKGTVLVDGLQNGGTVTPSGNVRLDLSLPKYKKAVYFGTGRLVIKGKCDAIQFFGQKLNATFRGEGAIHLYGDFDKNLETGSYWYDDDVKNKKDWGTGGMTITPHPNAYEAQQKMPIKVKNVTGKG